jgi:hypothetical protein
VTGKPDELVEIDTRRKVEVLLHFEKAFRQDWRFLHRLRALVAGALLATATTILGWLVAKSDQAVDPPDRKRALAAMIVLAVTGLITLAWFGSSLNTLKRCIVRIEDALLLFEPGEYIESQAIIDSRGRKWGATGRWKWGKGVFAGAVVAVVYILAVLRL